jgi:Putative peptidoglycan binding domain
MNPRRVCSRESGAVQRSEPSSTVRVIVAFLLTVMATALVWAQNEPVHKSIPPMPVERPAPQLATTVNQLGRSLPAEPQLLEGSGVPVWAKDYPGSLIAGIDGALYEPYRSFTIQRVQKALRERGLYAGPMNGILDWPTMKSIYAFQEANNLQRCGVPTPHTRKMLEQGSHTDLSF